MASGTISCSVWIQNVFQTGRYKKLELCLSKQWRHVGGCRVTTPPNLTSALDVGEWLVSRPGRFTPWKAPQYLLNRRLGGPQSRYGPFGEEKNIFTLPGLESRIVQVAIPTKVFQTYWLHLLLLLLAISVISNGEIPSSRSLWRLNYSLWRLVLLRVTLLVPRIFR
jgi:hypothetical protein